MEVHALAIGILMLGQVAATNDRYTQSGSAAGGTAGSSAASPFSAGDYSGEDGQIENAPGATNGSGLVPIIGGSPAADPYGSARENEPAQRAFTPPADASRAATPAGSPFSSYPSSGGALSSGVTAPPADAPGAKLSSMMRSMLTPPSGSRLAGRPTSLEEAISGASSRVDQSQRVEAYWDLCSSVADYYLGLREQQDLQRLRPLVQRVGPTWQQAEAELAVRISTSQRAALASQYRLASLSSNFGGPGTLPLPADIPHCGQYDASYEQVFASRPHPEAEELNALLPLRHAELKAAAAAVNQADEWLAAVAAQRSETSDGTGIVRALELVALRRRAFVQIARDYNRRIARYSELVAPEQVDVQRLLGMLILSTDRSGTARRSSSAASPTNRQSQSDTGSRTTFADEWAPAGDRSGSPDDAVRPASAEAETQLLRKERSLLVNPQ